MQYLYVVLMIVVIQETFELNPDILKYDGLVKDAEDRIKKIKASEKTRVEYQRNKDTYIHDKREADTEQSTAERVLPFAHNKTAYPLMNSSWCEDLSESCPFEYLTDRKFTEMLTEFCFDQSYGFMGVKDAGVDEEKEKTQFKGPKEYTNSQIDRIVEAVTEALAERNDTKKEFLTNPLFYCPHRGTERCYWKVYKIFSLMCLDLLYNRYARLSKHIFVHACEADWLDLPKIANIMRATCSEKEEKILVGLDEPK